MTRPIAPLLAVLVGGCMGSVIHTTPFNPSSEANSPGSYRPHQLFGPQNPVPTIGSGVVGDSAALIAGGGLRLLVGMNRYDNLYDVTVMIANDGPDDIVVRPAMFRLFDASRVSLRQITPDVAANSFLARTGTYHPLPPKYTATTTSTVAWDGSVQSKTSIGQDPVDQTIGAYASIAIAEGNSQLRSIASMFYDGGMADREVVPGRARLLREVFFLADSPWPERGAPTRTTVSILLDGEWRDIVFQSH